MTREVVTASGELDVAEAFKYVQTLPEYHHAYPVVDRGGHLTGIFTFNDLKRALAAGEGRKKLIEVTKKDLVHAHPDHTLDVIMFELGARGISQLPVVSRTDTSKLLGIVTLQDEAVALAKQDEHSDAAIDDIERKKS